MRKMKRTKELIAEIGLKGAGLINQQERLINRFLSSNQTSPIDDSFANTSPLSNPDGHVILPIIKGGEGVGSNPYHMCVLAHAFRIRGYEPILPICGSDINGCFQKPHNGRRYPYCANCQHNSRSLINEFGLEPTPIARYLDENVYTYDKSSDNVYRGVPVDELAMASTRRSLTRRSIDFDNLDHKVAYNGFLKSVIKLTDVAHAIFDKHDIVATIVSDPAYIYGGSFGYVAIERQIPTYSFGAGYSNNTLMFGKAYNTVPLQQFTDPSTIESHLRQPLSEQEQNQIDRLLESRFTGKSLLEPIADASESINTEEYDQTFGVFTNLIWDASLEGMDTTFQSVFNWIKATVSFARENPQILLVVKTHPAESVYGTSQPVAEWIREHLTPLPENLLLLEPDTDVSPYELLQDLDVGIVYNSTVGLEMATQGIPVVVAGKTHYKGYNFTYDPETPTAYHRLLSDSRELSITRKQRNRAKRYAHFIFIRKQFYLPELFTESDAPMITYNNIRDADVYDKIVNLMISDEPVISTIRPPSIDH